jgi:hypothetical protein
MRLMGFQIDHPDQMDIEVCTSFSYVNFNEIDPDGNLERQMTVGYLSGQLLSPSSVDGLLDDLAPQMESSMPKGSRLLLQQKGVWQTGDTSNNYRDYILTLAAPMSAMPAGEYAFRMVSILHPSADGFVLILVERAENSVAVAFADIEDGPMKQIVGSIRF